MSARHNLGGSKAQWDRRAFLGRKGLGSYGAGVLGAVLGEAAAPAAGLPPARGLVRVSRRAMACDFTLLFPAEFTAAVDAGCAALDEIERLESKLSAYRADSGLCYLNAQASEAPVTIDAELFGLLETAARLHLETGKAFDVATGTLIKAWGFFRGDKHVPAEAELAAALAASGMAHVQLDAAARSVRFLRPGLELNLGAIGKGHAIDRALELLRARFSADSVLMHGGQSSLKALGTPPHEPRGWQVEIGDPHHRGSKGAGRPLAAVWLKDRALGTSSAANQWFVEGGRRYGHLLDPRTGRPAEGLAGASVLAPSAAEADALSTAFFVMGIDGARRYCQRRPEVGAILVSEPEGGQRPEIVVLGAAAEVEVHAPSRS